MDRRQIDFINRLLIGLIVVVLLTIIVVIWGIVDPKAFTDLDSAALMIYLDP